MTWLYKSKLGWLTIAFTWTGIFMALNEFCGIDWAFWAAMPGAAFMFGMALVGIAYAWVINPLKERKK